MSHSRVGGIGVAVRGRSCVRVRGPARAKAAPTMEERKQIFIQTRKASSVTCNSCVYISFTQ